MKRKMAVWGLLGVAVAGLWVVISLAIPLWQAPTISALARFSCPMVAVGSVFHFGVKWYWVAASNFGIYALVGLIVENTCRSFRHHPQSAAQ